MNEIAYIFILEAAATTGALPRDFERTLEDLVTDALEFATAGILLEVLVATILQY